MFVNIVKDLVADIDQFPYISVKLRIVDLVVGFDNAVEDSGSVFNELLLQL